MTTLVYVRGSNLAPEAYFSFFFAERKKNMQKAFRVSEQNSTEVGNESRRRGGEHYNY